MRQFPKRALWLEHVEKHVEEDITGIDFSKPVLCLHSLCTEPCAFESPQDLREHLQDGHSIPMSSSGKKRRFDTENQPDTQEGKSDTVKRKRPRLQGKLHTAVLDPKPDQPGCHEIKSEPWSEAPNYNFVNYSAEDLESSGSDVTKSPTAISTSSSREVTRYTSPASSIDDAGTCGPTDPLMCIDPQLFSQLTVPLIRDESLCSSIASISPSSAMASPNACSITSVQGTIESERCMNFDIEEAHLLEDRSSVEDMAPTQSTLE
jgi:hypothetical protein